MQADGAAEMREARSARTLSAAAMPDLTVARLSEQVIAFRVRCARFPAKRDEPNADGKRAV